MKYGQNFEQESVPRWSLREFALQCFVIGWRVIVTIDALPCHRGVVADN